MVEFPSCCSFVTREVDGILNGVRHVLAHPSHGIVHLPRGVVARTVCPQFIIASSVEVHGTVDVEGEVRTRAGVRVPHLPCGAAARGDVHEGRRDVRIGVVEEHVVLRMYSKSPGAAGPMVMLIVVEDEPAVLLAQTV